MRNRVIKAPFKPPAAAPSTSVTHAAASTGSPASRHNLPKTTADKPINEPTDKSIPPPTITGVSATASKPSSTLSRTTSKTFLTVKKFVPIVANTANSRAKSATSTPCGPSHFATPCVDPDAVAIGSLASPVEGVGRHREQNHEPLDGFFPLRLHMKKD